MSQVTRWPPQSGGGGPTSDVNIHDSSGNALTSTAGALNVNTTGTATVSGTVSTDLNGLANFKTTKYTINTSAVQLVTPALTNRSSISFRAVCTGGNAIYIGNSNAVTTSTGYPLFNGESLQLDLTGATSPYAIASGAGQTLYVLEIG
jgi:hypothetical protein